MQKLPNHRYIFVTEYPLEDLKNYAKHKRLFLYNEQGCECAVCGIRADRLILGQGKTGDLHIDLYDKDLTVMMTVGHIIPASKGGKVTSDNVRPLCHKCNYKEGSGLQHVCEDPKLFYNHVQGKTVKKINGNTFSNGKMVAIIKDFFWHEKDGWKFSMEDNAGTAKINTLRFGNFSVDIVPQYVKKW